MCAAKNSYAHSIDNSHRQDIALQALNSNTNVTALASANNVSRRFVYKQKDKAMGGIKNAFQNVTHDQDNAVLFHLPITRSWIQGLVLSLMLDGKSNYRGIQNILENNIDYSLSLGSINKLVTPAALLANNHNQKQDLSKVTLGANDELFYHDQPILSGIDIPSLYCYLLSHEDSVDGDTWGVNLLDLQDQGYKPERIIADDGEGLRKGHAIVMEDTPCDYDNFHLTRDLMEVRRYLRNRLKTATTNYYNYLEKSKNAATEVTQSKYATLLPEAQVELTKMQHLSSSFDILVSWMEHDVLNMPGLPAKDRKDLFDFILAEFEQLAAVHPHRVQAICTKLYNQRDGLLAFVDVLDAKFNVIAEKHSCSLELIWKICELQKCEYYGDTYHMRSNELLDQMEEELFEKIEDDVLQALDSTERTSSMVENLNGRVKNYIRNRKGVDQKFLDLLRFYLNHVPFRRSARSSRVNKTPTEILTGHKHSHWMEMLGFRRFRRSAA